MENQGYIPARIVAGETIWISAANTAQGFSDITFSSYTPDGGYSLAYQFGAATPITVSAVANVGNTGWTLEVTAAQTLVWKPGLIPFAAYVSKESKSFAVDAGAVYVSASPLATSDWTALVAACDAALLSGATSGHVSFTVDGMSMSYKSTAELISLRDYAKAMERQELGTRQRRIIRARFT